MEPSRGKGHATRRLIAKIRQTAENKVLKIPHNARVGSGIRSFEDPR